LEHQGYLHTGAVSSVYCLNSYRYAKHKASYWDMYRCKTKAKSSFNGCGGGGGWQILVFFNSTGCLLFFYHVLLFTVGIGTVILGGISLGKTQWRLLPYTTSRVYTIYIQSQFQICSSTRRNVSYKAIPIRGHPIHPCWNSLPIGRFLRRLYLDVEDNLPPVTLHSKLLTSQHHRLAAVNISRRVSRSFCIGHDQLWSRYHQWRFEVQSEFALSVDTGWSYCVGLLLPSWNDTHCAAVQEKV
jgi:hypothetical protein